MTRTTFNTENGFLRWLQNRSRPYEIYYTEKRVFAIPTVSTRPIIYGVVRIENRADLFEGIRAVIEDEQIYPINDLAFDESRAEANDQDG